MVVQIVAGDRSQIGFVPDHHVTIGVGPEGCPDDLFVQEEGGRILGSLPLREDDRPLRICLLWVEKGVGHAVRFDLEGEVETVCREGFVVGGPIVRGQGVEGAAVLRYVTEDRSLGE